MLNKLQELSQTKPITLWTGAMGEELSKIKHILEVNKIPWKLISKYSLRGAEVEMAFDDLSFQKFNKL